MKYVARSERTNTMGLWEYVYAYLLGGITFIPLVLFVFVYLHPVETTAEHKTDSIKAGEVEETSQSGLETYKAGWLIVTQNYLDLPDLISSSTQSINDSQEAKSAYSSLYKLVQKDISEVKQKKPRSTSFDFGGFDLGLTQSEGDNDEDALPDQQKALLQPQGLNVSDKVKSSQRKHRFYAILKHGNLFLYKDESLKDVKHVIVLSGQFISMWPRTLTDSQLFLKSSAIAIIDSSKLAEGYDQNRIAPRGTFFVYCDINSMKEDWYFALIRATKQKGTTIPPLLDPYVFAKTLHFTTDNMMDLISTLYSSEGQLQSKWFNALIGRLFLAFKDTKVLEDYLYTKVSKKLNKIKKPGFLDEFIIKSIYAGDLAPFLSYPKLKEISPGGTVLVSTYMSYKGSFSVQIATKVNINLGARFKPREVDILFKITLKKLEGPMLIKIKPPPSNRIWYTFEVEPSMNIKIEPIISSRQMAYNIITNSIEKKFKDSIKESLVLPNWDDSVFYNTANETYRGGIWDPSPRKEQSSASSTSSTELSPLRLHESVKEEEEAVALEESDDSSIASRKIGSRSKLTNTISDLSRRMKKTSQAEFERPRTVATPTAESDLRDMSDSRSTTLNTLKKIGKWYFKENKDKQDEPYTPPEMISSRRTPRKASLPDFQKQIIESGTSQLSVRSTHSATPSYEFGIHTTPIPDILQGNRDDNDVDVEDPILESDDEADLSAITIPNASASLTAVSDVNASITPDTVSLDTHKLSRRLPQTDISSPQKSDGSQYLESSQRLSVPSGLSSNVLSPSQRLDIPGSPLRITTNDDQVPKRGRPVPPPLPPRENSASSMVTLSDV